MVMGILHFKETINHFFIKTILNKTSVSYTWYMECLHILLFLVKLSVSFFLPKPSKNVISL